MADYKLYFLNRSDHVRKRIDLDCRDDAHAIEVVGEHIKDAPFAMELWQGSRLVKRFDSTAD